MNNLIILNGNGATMTSRQIAELVGSRHDKVKQAIERLSKDNQNRLAVIQLPPLGDVKNHLGQTVEEYVFSGEQGERDSYVVVAQLSPQFTAKLVDEWKRLKGSTGIPQSFAEALQLAADQAKQLELAAPKVAFVDKYVTADSGSKGFRQVAKLLNANEKDFRAFLSDSKIMYKLGGEWMPYQCHADAGRFEVKGGVADNDHVYNSALFTPKGINWIAGLWARDCLNNTDTGSPYNR